MFTGYSKFSTSIVSLLHALLQHDVEPKTAVFASNNGMLQVELGQRSYIFVAPW